MNDEQIDESTELLSGSRLAVTPISDIQFLAGALRTDRERREKTVVEALTSSDYLERLAAGLVAAEMAYREFDGMHSTTLFYRDRAADDFKLVCLAIGCVFERIDSLFEADWLAHGRKAAARNPSVSFVTVALRVFLRRALRSESTEVN